MQTASSGIWTQFISCDDNNYTPIDLYNHIYIYIYIYIYIGLCVGEGACVCECVRNLSVHYVLIYFG